MPLNPIQLFQPSQNQIPIQNGDMTEAIFKAGQLALAQREQQRQAIQGLSDTFLSVAKLNQERTRMDNERLIAQAGLEEAHRHNVAEEQHPIVDFLGNPTGKSVTGGTPVRGEMGVMFADFLKGFQGLQGLDGQAKQMMDSMAALQSQTGSGMLGGTYAKTLENFQGKFGGASPATQSLATLPTLYKGMAKMTGQGEVSDEMAQAWTNNLLKSDQNLHFGRQNIMDMYNTGRQVIGTPLMMFGGVPSRALEKAVDRYNSLQFKVYGGRASKDRLNNTIYSEKKVGWIQ